MSRVLKSHLGGVLCFALLSWGAEGQGTAAESASTNQVALGTAAGSSVLTNAEQIHWLSRKEAEGRHPVLIRGVVTCTLSSQLKGAVVQDATGGIYCSLWNPPLESPGLGELVEVEGVTDAGTFAPLVFVSQIKRLGTGQLPLPVRPYWDQLINGSLDTLFVELEGVVTTVNEEGVTLLTHGGKINVLIFDNNGVTNGLSLKPDEGALVRLRACLFASWDPVTHQVNVGTVRMYAPSVTVVEPAHPDPFAITPKHVTDLLQFDPQASALRRVKVCGQIVHVRNGECYAMDGSNGFRFQPKEAVNTGVGELVEVVGFPSLLGPSPLLLEALVRKAGVAPLPEPRQLGATNLFRAENDAVRVRVDARLLSASVDRRTFELQAGLKRFVAYLDPEARAGAAPSRTKHIDLRSGSQVELVGVFAGTGGNRTAGIDVANFELLLNSLSDIRVLVRAPFWSFQRLLLLICALFSALGLALIWIRLLNHKVQQRTLQLQKEVHDREKAEQQRALAQERARIARDLHDDLGSSLTEISMLATASPGLELPAKEVTDRMETIAGRSRNLLHALDEIVWAVDPERDTLASVARYLASYAEEYLAGLKVACRVQIPNSFPDQVVSGEVRHHLFLAVKEALNNAVRHGGATEVVFRVRVVEDGLRILITDNGKGFDTFERSNGNGLMNLRHRLEHLRGKCELESAPGAGTTVALEIPFPAPSSSL